jgi:hypothetical protein
VAACFLETEYNDISGLIRLATNVSHRGNAARRAAASPENNAATPDAIGRRLDDQPAFRAVMNGQTGNEVWMSAADVMGSVTGPDPVGHATRRRLRPPRRFRARWQRPESPILVSGATGSQPRVMARAPTLLHAGAAPLRAHMLERWY